MSSRAIATLATSIAVTLTAIGYSHYAQVRDKEEMKKGVLRDKERLRIRRLEKKRLAKAVAGANSSGGG